LARFRDLVGQEPHVASTQEKDHVDSEKYARLAKELKIKAE